MEELDVVVDRGRELDSGLPGLAVDELDLHPAPEGLDHGVVVGAADGAHRWRQAGGADVVAEGPGRGLNAAVGVDHELAGGNAPAGCVAARP
jgi:hypothetical protein